MIGGKSLTLFATDVMVGLRGHHPAYSMVTVATVHESPFTNEWLIRMGSGRSLCKVELAAAKLQSAHEAASVIAAEARTAAESFVWGSYYGPEYRNHALADFAHDETQADVDLLHGAVGSLDELAMLATPGVAWGTR